MLNVTAELMGFLKYYYVWSASVLTCRFICISPSAHFLQQKQCSLVE